MPNHQGASNHGLRLDVACEPRRSDKFCAWLPNTAVAVHQGAAAPSMSCSTPSSTWPSRGMYHSSLPLSARLRSVEERRGLTIDRT